MLLLLTRQPGRLPLIFSTNALASIDTPAKTFPSLPHLSREMLPAPASRWRAEPGAFAALARDPGDNLRVQDGQAANFAVPRLAAVRRRGGALG
jgi:hypothetical protein